MQPSVSHSLYAPTTQAPTSVRPSVSPSLSLKPTTSVRPRESPRLSSKPSSSGRPSMSPTVSVHPSVSSKPTSSKSPTVGPTVSAQPSSSGQPSASPTFSLRPTSLEDDAPVAGTTPDSALRVFDLHTTGMEQANGASAGFEVLSILVPSVSALLYVIYM